MTMTTLVLGAMMALPVFGQAIDYKFLDGLADKARESSVIELGPEQLSLLSGLTGNQPPRDLTKLVKSVQVHSYEFDQSGMYDLQQVRAFRDRVKASGNWVQLMTVHERGGTFTDILIQRGADGKASGLLIVAAEDKELSIVHIDGVGDLKALAALGGLAGIPQLGGKK